MTKYFSKNGHSNKTEIVIGNQVFVRTPELDLPYKKGTAFTFSGEIRETEIKKTVNTTFDNDPFFLTIQAQKNQAALIERTCARIEKLGYELYHTSASGSRYFQNYATGKAVRVSDHLCHTDGLARFNGKNIIIEL
jgi:hypothetical protein